MQEAAALYERAIAIREISLGPEHLDLANLLLAYANFLRAQVRLRRAIEPPHLFVAGVSARSRTCLRARHRHHRESSWSRAPGSRCLAQRLRDLAADPSAFAQEIEQSHSRLSQGRLQEAAFFYERAIAIREKALGPEHPDLATSVNNYATLLYSQVRLCRAIGPCYAPCCREGCKRPCQSTSAPLPSSKKALVPRTRISRLRSTASRWQYRTSRVQ